MFIRKRKLYHRREGSVALRSKAPRRYSARPSPVALSLPVFLSGCLAVRRIIFNPVSLRPLFWASLDPAIKAISGSTDHGAARSSFQRLNLLRTGSAAESAPQTESGRESSKRLRLRLLVLQAKRVPYFHDQESGEIYVPRLFLEFAAREILAFESEKGAAGPIAPGRDNWLWVLAFLSLLLFWDALRHGSGGWGLHFLPPFAETWADLGALAKAKVLGGEWWRVFTALTLHADASHVLGNCVFGALFMLPLCNRAGLGAGVFMAILGGALGNLLNIFFQAAGTRSIGFSTAVFAALGALCGLAVYRYVSEHAAGGEPGASGATGPGSGAAMQGLNRPAVLPASSALSARAAEPAGLQFFMKGRARGVMPYLAAGLAFLAFLGGSGEPRVDFSAHALGLLGGLSVSLPLAALLARIDPAFSAHPPGLTELSGNGRLAKRRSRAAQAALLSIPLGLLALSWYLAFSGGV